MTGNRTGNRGLSPISSNFPAKLGDFLFQGFVLGHLAAQKVHGDRGFLLDAARGEQIGVGELVVAVAEVARLDPALSAEPRVTTPMPKATEPGERVPLSWPVSPTHGRT